MPSEPERPGRDDQGTHGTIGPASEPVREIQPTVNTDPSGGSTVRDRTPGRPPEASGEGPALATGSGESGRASFPFWDTTPPPELREGASLFGKYRLISLLGVGGMGEVWLVENIDFGVKRALKLIKTEVARNDRGWRRFKLEAQLMAKLGHASSVIVYYYDRAESLGYIEMEYVAGTSIAEALKQPGTGDGASGRPMPLSWVVPILDQLCDVLQVAHGHVDESTGKSRPIIHRDLKPANLMLVRGKPAGQNLKVLDFGIAKMTGDDDDQKTQLTGSGEFLGTVAYSSPEQIRDADPDEQATVDGRSDLYSVGVILYQFLTGVVPYRGSIRAVLAAHVDMSRRPPPFAKANPSVKVSPAVERVVMQCLEKDPKNRPRDASELADRFRKAAGGGGGRGGKGFPWSIAFAALVVVAVTAAILVPRLKGRGGSTPVAPRETSVTVIKPIPPSITPTATLWTPSGYTVVNPGESAVGDSNEPERLRRVADGTEFRRVGPGLYLPVGMRAEDDVFGWPGAIVPADTPKGAKDGMRFVRVPAKKYVRGDLRPGPPAVDAKGNACFKHWAATSTVYMQETETTNEQVEQYLGVHGEKAPMLRDWREAYDASKRGLDAVAAQTAARMPAVAVSYPAALEIAMHFGGRLPTESEWELAAKSEGDDSLWAWGRKPPDKRFAKLFDPIRPGPDPVKSHPKDRSSQGIFDLTGNVREWCLGPYLPYNRLWEGNDPGTPVEDHPWDVAPRLPLPDVEVEREFAVRGGSYRSDLDQAMIFLRDAEPASSTLTDLGFRIAIDCPARP